MFYIVVMGYASAMSQPTLKNIGKYRYRKAEIFNVSPHQGFKTDYLASLKKMLSSFDLIQNSANPITVCANTSNE